MRALRLPLLGLVCALAAWSARAEPHAHLSQTGFDAASALAFSPKFPLWSDGADKQRWLQLPPGMSIDARDPDAWVFPVGTRLWKQFSHAGRPIETRVVERRADGWHYATYVWRVDGSDADLAPARGIAALPVMAAPGGRYAVPGRGDCVACHGGATVPVLGLSTLQLSPADLRALVERGLVRGLPRRLIDEPPRSIAARSALEAAALGYLHGNCAHCHHPNPGRVPVGLTLLQRTADPERSAAQTLRSMLDTPSRYQPRDADAARAVVPGDARSSVLLQRMRVRDGRAQMPPLGTDHPDGAALDLLTRWIDHDLPHHKEP